MPRIGNEAKLIIALVNERANARIAEHKSKNEGSDEFKSRTVYSA